MLMSERDLPPLSLAVEKLAALMTRELEAFLCSTVALVSAIEGMTLSMRVLHCIRCVRLRQSCCAKARRDDTVRLSCLRCLRYLRVGNRRRQACELAILAGRNTLIVVGFSL